MSTSPSPRPEATHILAVDLGTSGCKTALVSLEGEVSGWAFQAVPLLVLPDHGAEQEPARMWEALVATTRQVLERTGLEPGRVGAVCCSCQGEGTIPVDRQGRELRNAILWMDMRGEAAIRRRAGGFPSLEGYGALKLARWLRLTGGAPSLSGKDPAAHMLLVKEAFPEVYRDTYKFLNVLDYLNLRLTGRFVATVDSILTSWVTDNRRMPGVRYHPGLLKASGIDPDKFPELVPCTEVLGTLLPAVAEALGLPAGTPVVAGAVDNSAAAVGSGEIADFGAHLYVGTSSWIGAHVPFKRTDLRAGIASVPCALPDRYLMMAMQSAAGANLAFLKDRILCHQDALRQEAPGPDVYGILDRIAAGVPAGSGGLIYTPWLIGERSPVSAPRLRAGLFNLTLEHSREHVIRAFLEGVALNTRWLVGPVERFLGRRLEALTLVGGGGLSDTWCRIFADVLGVPIRQPEQPMQANALGAARIAQVGLGLGSFGEARSRIRTVFEPDPAHRAVYDDAFGTFVELHRRLGPLYRKLNAPRGRSL